MTKEQISLDMGRLDLDKPEIVTVGDPSRSTLWQWVGLSFSAILIIAITRKILDVQPASFLNIPTDPLFWLCLIGSYLATPASEWIIYRRLWGLPVLGLMPLLKKQITNEVVLGYLGEAQLYLWARNRTLMRTAPYGAIKDVSILSAMTGNVATLAMLALAWPFINSEHLGASAEPLAISVGVILISSLVVLGLRQKIFSLPGKILWWIGQIQFARISIGLICLAGAWSRLLPDVATIWILILAVFRLLISRLPALPNKDIIFAALVVFLFGSDQLIGIAISKVAFLTLALHIVLGILLTVASIQPVLGAKL
jgi:hypothetical protein